MDVRDLPGVNAVLNASAALLLTIGYSLIRRRKIDAHRNVMIGAFGVSVLFLICYLIYHARVGSVRFERPGPIRAVYLSILMTHTALAVLVPFLAIVTLYRGLKGNYQGHRRIAKWTLPIWLYVSVTGVVVYWMLYRL